MVAPYITKVIRRTDLRRRSQQPEQRSRNQRQEQRAGKWEKQIATVPTAMHVARQAAKPKQPRQSGLQQTKDKNKQNQRNGPFEHGGGG